MLILTRRTGESLMIGDSVVITVFEVKGNQVRIGIDAPKNIPVYREEIYKQIQEENKAAASSVSDMSLEGAGAFFSGNAGDDANKKKPMQSLAALKVTTVNKVASVKKDLKEEK